MRARSLLAAASVIALALFAHNASHAGKGDARSSKTSKGDYRSAKTGKYVEKGYAEKNKSTTVREERKKK